MAGPSTALEPASGAAIINRAGEPGRGSQPPPSIRQACELVSGAIAHHDMVGPGSHVLAAFSGGADSTALALILRALGYRVTLGHVNHGMRPDSKLDEFHCRATALRLGLPIEVVSVGVEPPTQARARSVRYEALERLSKKAGAGRIATGHTLNDEAETVKMRLDRGGFGLGIPPVRGPIIRPLLGVGRRLTEAVCREAGLLFLDDPSNEDPRFTRSRIRKELMARPEQEVRRYVSIGADTRARKAALDQVLADLSARALQTDTVIRLDRRAVRTAPNPVRSGLVRLALERAGIEASGRLVEDILKKVAPNPRSSLDLPGGLAIWCEVPSGTHRSQGAGEGQLVLGRRTRTEFPAPADRRIRVPGVTTVEGWDLKVSVSYEPASGVPGFGRPGPAAPESGGAGTPPHCEVFDADALGTELALRRWRPGDRFRPLRGPDGPGSAGDRGSGTKAGGTKKLQDFFVDCKVPRLERRRTPLITSGDEIAWVVGHRIDDRFKVTPASRTVARIRVDLAGQEPL